MAGDRSLTDKLDIDFKYLKGLIYYYTEKNNIIRWDTWEKIISLSCNGEWIDGDKYMADAIKLNYGLNVKSVKKQFTKTKIEQCIDYIQCRVPIQNESLLTCSQIGEKIIETIVDKKTESFNDLDIDTMIDVIVVHNRMGDTCNVRIFFEYQPDYTQYNYEWIDNCGYIAGNSKWKLRRNKPDDYGQTRLEIKTNLSLINCDFDFSFKSPLKPDPTKQEVLEQYETYVANNLLIK